QLETDDGVDDDDEDDEQCDVKERDHGFEDGVEHHLKTCDGKKIMHGTSSTLHYAFEYKTLPQDHRSPTSLVRELWKNVNQHKTAECRRHAFQNITQMAILVCSNLALQICKLAASLTRQECKLETS
ncbi:hypothetical protein AVEN_175858-1, partial [Araneus ventricosus]